MSQQLPQAHRTPLPRPINPNYPFDVSKGMYIEREEQEYVKPVTETEVAFRIGSYRKSTRVSTRHDIDIVIRHTEQHVNEEEIIKEGFRALADRLCEEHPAISTDASIFGGVPHIKNVRLTVGDILAKLYVYGNVQEILDTYAPHVSEEQIKEAIAYAQDFLEIACDPNGSLETDD